ncbi:MAG: GntR family transcriptional regulator [Actinobacteria bacterium]|nr:GntR family transcriptional regulator [Actinomycetota bacterium]
MITAILREMILTGAVEDGTQMRQRDLAAQLGVSPTPVREAIRRLEAEGLLESDPHRGSTVVTSWSVEDRARIRARLESLAAEKAAEKIDEETLAELEEINRQFAATGTADAEERAELNSRFHSTVIGAADSPTLVSLVSLLVRASPRSPRTPQPSDSSATEHADLILALRERDGTRAARLAEEHVLRALAVKAGDGAATPRRPVDASRESG